MKLTKIPGEIRVWLKFLAVIRNPNDTPKVFEFVDLLVKHRGIEYFRDMLNTMYKENGTFEQQFSKGYLPPFPKAADLENLPKGTLGRDLIDSLRSRGLDLNFFPLLDYRDPVKYIVYRAYLAHDITHLVFDYQTSIEEEVALQGFTYAQTRSPTSMMLIAGGLIHLVTTEPQNIFRAFRKLVDGFQHGLKNPQALSLPFFEQQAMTLSEFRAHHGIVGRENIPQA